MEYLMLPFVNKIRSRRMLHPCCRFLVGLALLWCSRPVAGQWSIFTVAPDASEGVSIKVIGGKPAIAFYGYDGGAKLMYVRALDSAGTTWSDPVAVDDANVDYGAPTSLTAPSGLPAIAYFDQYGSAKLKYVRAKDVWGAEWETPIVLDSSVQFSWEWNPSVAVVNGRVAAAYFKSTGADLMFVHATNWNGDAWGPPIPVDTAGRMGIGPSLAVVSGYPAVSYYDIDNANLKFVRATDASGLAWNTPTVIDSPGNVGYYSALAIVGGNPAIAYSDATNNRLKFVRANNAAGSAWGTRININTTTNGGRFSFEIIGGNPAMAYIEAVNGHLKYVRAGNATGSTWPASELVDAVEPGGSPPVSLTSVLGAAGIAYLDRDTYDVKFAIRLSPAPTPLPNATRTWKIYE